MKDTKVITVVNNKGGVGKTTSAISIAVSLAEFQKDTAVLLIDFDCQASATVHLTGDKIIGKKAGIVTILERSNNLEVHDVYTETNYANLFFVPNEMRVKGNKLSIIKTIGQSSIGVYKQLKNKLDTDFVKNFDYVIIDCAPSTELDLINALVASDYYIVPTLVADESIFGISEILEFCKEVQESENPSLKLLGVFLTQVNRSHKKSKGARKLLKDALGDFMFNSEIPTQIKFSELASQNKTIFDVVGKNGRGAKEYIDLTDEIIERIKLSGSVSKSKKSRNANQEARV
jgi:chromosome partitioning protein